MTADPEVRVFEQAASLLEAAAGEVVAALGAAVAVRGRASLVLAGGATPRGLYRLLASPPWRERVEWGAVELFWGDERCVPADDPASNFRMVEESLLAGLGAAPAAVHRIPGELGAEAAARAYDRTVRAAAGDPPRFDLVLLGMGADGHTASLFPATADPDGGGRLAIATRAPEPPRERVSLTLAALNAAAAVVVLVAGAEKAQAVARVLQLKRPGSVPAVGAGTSTVSVAGPSLGRHGGRPLQPARSPSARSPVARPASDLPPAARVRPTSGRLVWLLDRAATRELDPIAAATGASP